MPIKYDDKGAIKRPNEVTAFDKAMMMNYAACAKSVKYFAENYYYIVNPVTGSQLIPLRDYQIQMIEAFQNNRFNIICSARQVGKTTCSAIYLLWFACFNKDKTIAILGNKADTAKSILSEVKYAYERLPVWLKPGVKEYNAFTLEFDNGCRIIAKATSADALRGESISLLFLDEAAFVPANIAQDFWTANFPTLSTGGSCIIVSTPNGTANLFYTLWKEAVDGINTFKPLKFDWSVVPERDEKWRDETIRSIGKIKFNQEHNCAFNGSVVTLIDSDYILKYMKSKDPILQPDDFTRIWKHPEPNHKYLLSADTAAGVGSDFSVINVFDITYYPLKPAEQVAIWRNNLLTPPAFAEMVHESAKHWNNAYVIGEINGLSNEVLNRLINDYEYENIFFDYDDDTFGVYADKKSKSTTAVNFKHEVENGNVVIVDGQTITELGYFEEVKPGVYKAKEGRNLTDDCVMTCIWAVYFLKSAFFDDVRSEWGKPVINEDAEEEHTPESQLDQESLDAFLTADEKQNGEGWLDEDEQNFYRNRL